ncbi:MAG: 50S ribosomal protein L21 [Verrucomicrobiota bacterium]|nr:50S ribosomal protein L21 [Verrucomicrobiota bacterium]
MYAIIKTGGKQYRVQKGDELEVELLLGAEGKITFQPLSVHNGKELLIGKPFVEKSSVQAEIIGEMKGPKVIAFKYKKCKNYRLTRGHRQRYTCIRITEITA